MLVLSRRRQESVKIADNIRLTVLDVKNKQVRLGFTAPVEVEIDREEVYLKKISGRKNTFPRKGTAT